MISLLHGIIVSKHPPSLIIEVNGVGYEVFASMNTFCHLPENKEKIHLLTYLAVREDSMTLYGFLQEQERHLFKTLIKVNGIGPKLAMTILSGIEPAHFIQSIQGNDISRLVNIPGIGKKTAQRLLIETKDALSQDHFPTSHIENLPESFHQPQQDAISGLIGLGYKPNDARTIIKKIGEQSNKTEELIKLALQQLLKG